MGLYDGKRIAECDPYRFHNRFKRQGWEHTTKQNPASFSARYNVNRLVYFQGFLSLAEAESAEKYIKGKKRECKRALITKHNPKWKDLRSEIKQDIYSITPTGLNPEHSTREGEQRAKDLPNRCRKNPFTR